MRYSHAYIPTLRQVPAEAELISHKLLLRAGYMRKLASGIYSWLPLGLRVVQKVAAIVRDETMRVGGQEVLLPALHPEELWDATGRSQVDVLFRLRDRSDRGLVLGMTHEEVITHLIRDEVRSYRQLPLLFFQIQTKFRDEPRPRGGLLRCREFVTHDAYSFHTTPESLEQMYQIMFSCYTRVLDRLGLDYLAVEAESDTLGEFRNHEFVVLTDTGEETIFVCQSCGYAASSQRCEIGDTAAGDMQDPDPLRIIDTPDCRTIDEVSQFLQIAPERLMKTLIYQKNGSEIVAALVRGDRDLNEAKLARVLGCSQLEMAEPEMIRQVTGAPVGFAGPHGLKDVSVIADKELKAGGNWVTGANREDAHVMNLNPGRDYEVHEWADIRNACDGDPCPRCNEVLEAQNGIGAGHIFQLGSVYSELLNACYQDAHGKELPFQMGTYGFGVSRAVAAIAEQYADADGLLWPASVAPFDIVLLCLNQDQDHEVAGQLYDDLLSAGMEVLYDDRNERAGVKFKDADLSGIPIQLVVGRGVKEGKVEIRIRGRSDKHEVSLSDAVTKAMEVHQSLMDELVQPFDKGV